MRAPWGRLGTPDDCAAPGRTTTASPYAPTLVSEGVVIPKPGITDKKPRAAIPMTVRHEVWSRDEGRCTWTQVDGTRCPERMMLEVDHPQTLHGYGAGGGLHKVDNLRLTCRHHNQQGARERLGHDFWEKKKQEWNHSV